MSQSIAPKNTNTIFASAGQILPISLGYYPSEGSKVASTQYNFASSLNYFEDLSRLKALGMETAIQSIWIDNSANPQAISLQIAGSGQAIVMPGYTQGVFPALFSDEAQFYISCAAYTSGTTALTKVCLLNVPVNTASIWSTQFANLPQNGSGVSTPQLLGTQVFTGTSNPTLTETLIPAVSGKRFFITGIYVTASGVAAASSGPLTITISDTSSNVVVQDTIYVPSASANLEQANVVFNLQNLQYIAPNVGSSATLVTSEALTTGYVYATLFGGYTTYTP